MSGMLRDAQGDPIMHGRHKDGTVFVAPKERAAHPAAVIMIARCSTATAQFWSVKLMGTTWGNLPGALAPTLRQLIFCKQLARKT